MLMRAAETFCWVRVLTWTILSNHFHILLEVPEKPDDFDLSEREFWLRIEALYSVEAVDGIRAVFRSLEAPEMSAAGQIMAREYRPRFLNRMLDLSEFMKTLKRGSLFGLMRCTCEWGLCGKRDLSRCW
jgi:putative transposase